MALNRSGSAGRTKFVRATTDQLRPGRCREGSTRPFSRTKATSETARPHSEIRKRKRVKETEINIQSPIGTASLVAVSIFCFLFRCVLFVGWNSIHAGRPHRTDRGPLSAVSRQTMRAKGSRRLSALYERSTTTTTEIGFPFFFCSTARPQTVEECYWAVGKKAHQGMPERASADGRDRHKGCQQNRPRSGRGKRGGGRSVQTRDGH